MDVDARITLFILVSIILSYNILLADSVSLNNNFVRLITTQVKNDEFQYAYTVSYTPTSETSRLIGFFRVDLRRRPTEHPLTHAYTNEFKNEYDHDKILDESEQVYLIKKSSPKIWDHEHVMKAPYHGWWSCYLYEPLGCLRQGGVQSGFIFIAKEPPGVRNFILEATTLVGIE